MAPAILDHLATGSYFEEAAHARSSTAVLVCDLAALDCRFRTRSERRAPVGSTSGPGPFAARRIRLCVRLWTRRVRALRRLEQPHVHGREPRDLGVGRRAM